MHGHEGAEEEAHMRAGAKARGRAGARVRGAHANMRESAQARGREGAWVRRRESASAQSASRTRLWTVRQAGRWECGGCSEAREPCADRLQMMREMGAGDKHDVHGCRRVYMRIMKNSADLKMLFES